MHIARFLAIASVLIAGCTSSGGSTPELSAANGKGEPPAGAAADRTVSLKILDYQGLLDLIASHKGKVVVMDAWSTSCAPCIKEFPKLVALHHKFGPDRVACISLSFDYEGIGRPEDVSGPVLDFLRKMGATFDNLLSSEESTELYAKLELAAIPAVFVYDQNGQLRKRFDNAQGGKPFTYDDVERLVADMVVASQERS